jgi:hypothetical protein
MANVKKIGNQVEKEFATLMYAKGWWVHLLNDKVNGQPLDAIMAKDEVVWFLDIKNVSDKDYFLHSRIEPNQHTTMKMLLNRGMKNVGFAIKFDDGWFLLYYKDINFDEKKTYKNRLIELKIS